MSDGASEMLQDERVQEVAERGTAMYRCGGVVIFTHRSVAYTDYLNAIKILISGAEECLSRIIFK